MPARGKKDSPKVASFSPSAKGSRATPAAGSKKRAETAKQAAKAREQAARKAEKESQARAKKTEESMKRNLDGIEKKKQQQVSRTKETQKARRNARRDSEERTDRAIEHRLGHLPHSVWSGLTNQDGEKIWDVAKRAVKLSQPKKGRLSTKL